MSILQRLLHTRMWPLNWRSEPDQPKPRRQESHCFALHLSLEAMNHPRLGAAAPVALSAWLELVLFNQEREPLILDEIGFVRLRDRKRHLLRQDSVLWRGKPIHLSATAASLRNGLSSGEALAPYVQTSSGLVYLEQPFVIVGGDEAKVPVEPTPKPRYLSARAKPPKSSDESQVSNRR